MNEQQFSAQIRRALDESSQRLPYKVTHRLAAARENALRAMDAPTGGVVLVTGGAATLQMGEFGGRSIRWRAFALAVLPVLMAVAGLLTVIAWDEADKAQETAEVDAAVLTDDVPIAAYTDRGFGVFLKNNRQ